MSRRHQKIWATLNYIEHFFILASAITGSLSFSPFVSLHGILIEIKGSTKGLIIFTITAAIKCKSIINKKEAW